jgi:hypothetical protein
MKRIFSIYLISLLPLVAVCQTEKQLVPSDLKQQTIVTEPLSLLKGFLRVGFTYSYSVLDKYFNDSGKKNYFPESAWGKTGATMFWGQYGITDRVMVELGVPYTNDRTIYHYKIYAPEIDTMVFSNRSIKGRGLGDIILSTTYQIIPSAENNFSLKATIDITLPTGRKNPANFKSSNEYDAPTGYGAFVISPRITARKVSYPYSYSAYTFYNYNFEGSRIITPGDHIEKKFTYGNFLVVGASFIFHLNEWIAMANELNYSFTGKGKIENTPSSDLSTSWQISYEPRLVFQIKRFRIGEAVNIPLKGRNRGADPSYVLIAQYVF